MGAAPVSRIVLDTNALVSALLFTGVASKVVTVWEGGSATLLVSRPILDEYLRVLAYPKFRLTRSEIQGLIEGDVLPFAEIVRPTQRVRVIERDPSDNMFLECAITGRAEILISGDKHLLSLKKHRRVKIQSPAEFLKSLGR